jgi:hypothetical protein
MRDPFASLAGIKKKTKENEMKLTTKAFLAVSCGLACICSSLAATDLTDGFTVKHYQVLITVGGSTKVMADDMKLRDGIEIHTDGTVIVPGGDRTTLKEGDSMTFGGTVTRAATGKVEQLKVST